MLKLKFQYSGHLMRRADSWGQEAEGGDRGWHCWMTSPTQWTWVWVSSRRWWRTGKPGMLQSLGSPRVRRGWETEQQQGYWKRGKAKLPNCPDGKLSQPAPARRDWRVEVGGGAPRRAAPREAAGLPGSESLCVRGEGRRRTQGPWLAGEQSKEKAKAKVLPLLKVTWLHESKTELALVTGDSFCENHKGAIFPSSPPPVSALGISQAKRAAQFESLSLRNQEMITWNRSTSLLRTVNPVITRILSAIIYLQSNLNSCKSIYRGTPEVCLFSFCTIYLPTLNGQRSTKKKMPNWNANHLCLLLITRYKERLFFMRSS